MPLSSPLRTIAGRCAGPRAALASPSMRLATCLVVLAAMLLAGVPLTPTARPAHADPATLPEVWPTPRSMEPYAPSSPPLRLPPVVTLVAGDTADPAAVHDVEAVLRSAGVTTIRRRPPNGEVPEVPVAVWLGGPEEDGAAAPALAALGVDGPEELPPDGYVLVAGRDDTDRGHVVLAGASPTGTFYAVQTLRQLIRTGPGRASVPSVHVRDWPGFGLRGGMESFYGPVWSQSDRLRQIDFLARYKMNAFFYGPADDVRTGTRWDALYDADELAALQEVVDAGKRRHVDFIYRVSPSAPLQPANGICHSDPADLAALVARFEQLWDIGVRTYTIAWDDIPGGFQCEQDTREFGDDPEPLAAAQAHVTNHVQEHFIQKHPGVSPLVTVPTEYAGNATTPYRTRFDELLNDEALLYWTGPSSQWAYIHVADIVETQQAFPNHELLIWDNYPVNDFAPHRLFLGPLVEREAGLEQHSSGFTANEMNQQEASLLPLFTIADFTWNPQAYDPERSWDAGLREFGGEAYPALRTFAENSRSSTIDGAESPRLKPLIDAFERAYRSGEDLDPGGHELDAEFGKVARAPAELRAKLDNARFLEQAEGHLDKLELYGSAGRTAIDLLRAQGRLDRTAAWEARLALEQARSRAREIPQEIAAGVVAPFLALAARESDSWLGTRWSDGIAEVTGGPPAAPSSALGQAADRDVATVYRADRAARPGESLTIALTEPRPLREVVILQDAEAPVPATVQLLGEDGTWTDIGELSGGATTVDADGLAATAVRLTWAGRDGAPAPRIHEVIPRYADALTADLTVDRPPALVAPGTTTTVPVRLEGIDDDRLAGTVRVDVPDGWTVRPSARTFDLESHGRTVEESFDVEVTVPDGDPGAEPGTYPIRFSATAPDGRSTTAETSLTVARPSGKAYRDIVLDDEPLAYWRLGDGPESERAIDASGNARHGSYHDPVVRGAPGALTGDDDTSARFAGGYVEIEDSPGISPTGPFTIETWVRPDGAGTEQALVEKYDRPAFNGYALRMTADGKAQGWVLGSAGNVHVTGSVTVRPGAWHHLALVYDGSTLTVYVDGIADRSVETTVAPGEGDTSLKLGARGDDAQNRLTGQLDEPALYDRALTADDIAIRYLAGVS